MGISSSLKRIIYFFLLSLACFLSVKINLYALYFITIFTVTYSIYKFGWVNGRYSLYFFAFLLSLYADINYVLYIGIVDVIIALIYGKNKNLYLKTNSYFLLLSYLGFLIVGLISSLLFSRDIHAAIKGCIIYVIFFFMLLGNEIYVANERINWNSIRLFMYSGSVVLITWFLSSNTIGYLLSITRGLIRLFYNRGARSNTLAGIIAPFFLFSVFEFINSRGKQRALSGACAFGNLIILLFLQSRGTYVAIAIVLFIYFIKKGNSYSQTKKRWIQIMLSISLCIIVFFSIPKDVIGYFIKGFIRLLNYSGGEVSNGRWPLYIQGLEIWYNHMILGNGFLQFISYNMPNGDPHNFIIAYMASVGIIGTIFFLIFLYVVCRAKDRPCFWANEIYGFIFQLIVIEQCIHGMFEPVLTTSLPLGLFMITCMILRSSYNKKLLEMKQ